MYDLFPSAAGNHAAGQQTIFLREKQNAVSNATVPFQDIIKTRKVTNCEDTKFIFKNKRPCMRNKK